MTCKGKLKTHLHLLFFFIFAGSYPGNGPWMNLLKIN